MVDFYLDATRDVDLLKEDGANGEVKTVWGDVGDEDDDDDDEGNKEIIALDSLPTSSEPDVFKARREKDFEFSLENTYFAKNKNNAQSADSRLARILEKSILQPGFEKLHAIPMAKENKKLLRIERKKIRDRTKGRDWYNLPATEVTDEIKNDLEILKMRSALDPKHVYKKNDIKVTPKYFQIGKVVEHAADFYNGRIPKSQRKRTIVDELMADSECRAYQKKKYKEIMDSSRRKGQKAHAKAKKLKKKKK